MKCAKCRLGLDASIHQNVVRDSKTGEVIRQKEPNFWHAFAPACGLCKACLDAKPEKCLRYIPRPAVPR